MVVEARVESTITKHAWNADRSLLALHWLEWIVGSFGWAGLDYYHVWALQRASQMLRRGATIDLTAARGAAHAPPWECALA